MAEHYLLYAGCRDDLRSGASNGLGEGTGHRIQIFTQCEPTGSIRYWKDDLKP